MGDPYGSGYGFNLWPILIAALVGVVLGIWKLAEVAMWLWHHLHWSVT